MVDSQKNLPIASDWQITERTIWCPLVEARVTIRVTNDWNSYCCWHKEIQERIVQQKAHGKSEGRLIKCKKDECGYVSDYRDKLIREEFGEEE